MRKLLVLLFTLATASQAASQFNYIFDQTQNRWTLSNSVVTVTFQLSAAGAFQLAQIGRKDQLWQAVPGASPIRFSLNGKIFDGNTSYKLVSQNIIPAKANGQRQVILLADLNNTVQVKLNVDLYPDQPVVRFSTSVKNITGSAAIVTAADMLPVSLSDQGGPFRTFSVNQWAVAPRPLDFEAREALLKTDATPMNVLSGAHGTKVSWLAVRDPNDRGLFAGWEFNGLSQASVRDLATTQTLNITAPIDSLHHPLPAGATFYVPGAFLGFFAGDWDEAGYRTQRFVESTLAMPAPDLQRFPYMSWDSWGFQEQFDETSLRQDAAIAASLGVELFIIDLGWARQIGDWYADPVKFPSGLAAFSDYVHSLGMKFGLHITPAEVSPTAPVLLANPDWASTENDNYYNSVSLCLSNRPAHDWVVSQILRVIDDYNVDWLLQDGQNMVKRCTKTTHTHDPLDSNYANAVEGIDSVVEEVTRQRPNVSWENCENGGSMMTFKMVQNYVTSITNDASGALGSRQGVYGATYPFSPRFADRYSPEDPVTPYNTQSYMFGGPWHLMNKLDLLTPDQLSFAASEIAAYKQVRGYIRDGKVYHLTAAPGLGLIDAIESSDLGNEVIAVVTREGGEANTFTLKLEGVSSSGVYTVSFQNDARVLSLTGLQLNTDGVLVNLPAAQSSEIVYAQRH